MIVALNNKSNLTKKEFNNYLEQLNKITTNHELILCPSFINISSVKTNNITLGAQNVSSYNEGAYTGEISASQLQSYNVKYALVGHSERRLYQKESPIDINHKIKELFEYSIIPILCIGETKEEKDKGLIQEILTEQLNTALNELSDDEQNKVIIAYEPRWSIGTGIIPTNEEIKESINIIKRLYPKSKILYGGSANEENINLLKEIKAIDGYLLGSLSLKVDNLKEFLEKLN